MPKTNSTEIIAARFQISKESAKYFLGQVQKSFKTEKPSQQLIVEFMTGKKFALLPKPHQIATMMNTAGVWAFPLFAEPLGPVDEEDIYF